MSLTAVRPRLEQLTRDLLRAWDETRQGWRDDKAQEFETKYLSELVLRVNKATAAIDKLDELLAKVKSDCD